MGSAHMQVMMILTTSSLVPYGYRINNIEVIFPMGLVVATHLLWPFALNPWFISFSVSCSSACPEGVLANETSSRCVWGSFLGIIRYMLFASVYNHAYNADKPMLRVLYPYADANADPTVGSGAIQPTNKQTSRRRRPRVPHGEF